jgi:hypothetical protein
LVDDIGGVDKAIEYAAKQAKLGMIGNWKSIPKLAVLNKGFSSSLVVTKALKLRKRPIR